MIEAWVVGHDVVCAACAERLVGCDESTGLPNATDKDGKPVEKVEYGGSWLYARADECELCGSGLDDEPWWEYDPDERDYEDKL